MAATVRRTQSLLYQLSGEAYYVTTSTAYLREFTCILVSRAQCRRAPMDVCAYMARMEG